MQRTKVLGRNSRNSRNSVGIAIVATFALMLAACIGSVTSSTASASTPSNAGTGLAAAQKMVNQYSARPTSIFIRGGTHPPIHKAIPRHKTIVYINCGIPECQAIGQGIKDATDALGWKLTTINTQFTPEAVHSAYVQAARDLPNAVIGAGYPTQWYQSTLPIFIAHHIPTIISASPAGAGGGITYSLNSVAGVVLEGQIDAAEVTVANKGKANTLAVELPDEPNTVPEVEKGFIPTYKKFCPGCKYTVFPQSDSDIGTTLPGNVVGYLRAHPAINTVYTTVDAAGVGLPAALSQAGLANKVKYIGNTGTSTNLEYIKNGQEVSTTVVDFIVWGWQCIDALVRVFTGTSLAPISKSPANVVVTWLITRKNISQYPISTNGKFLPLVPNIAGQFEKLWGIG